MRLIPVIPLGCAMQCCYLSYPLKWWFEHRGCLQLQFAFSRRPGELSGAQTPYVELLVPPLVNSLQQHTTLQAVQYFSVRQLSRLFHAGLMSLPFSLAPPVQFHLFYPNAFTDEIFVENLRGDECFIVHDFLGRNVLEGKCLGPVQMPATNSGMYFLTILNKTNQTTFKLVKR